MLNIVLYEPEIPYNTGNIGRTCVASGAGLHLIRPLGFQLTDKYIRRAGLDYWPRLHPAVHDDYAAFRRAAAGRRVWLATTKAHQIYTDVSFGPDDFIMFGPESRGIPEEILTAHEADCIRIPMMAGERSLNLCNSAAIVLYEALRQNHFEGLELHGALHHLVWKTDDFQ
jgi:tRNA (cytidine/uridine-2'-O-)-methyltransferase